MLSERLKAVRLKQNLSQREIAQTLEIGLKSWQQYENGSSIPGGKVLEALLLKLRVNINWLLSGTGSMYFNEGEVEYDRELMIQAIAALDDCLAKRGMELDPVRKGKVAVKLFENLKRSGVSAGNLEMIGKEAGELVELV
ncbi:MAG: transcriptional repressor DicA [Pelotomaculum sp. PtaB.Bin104]|nr:MAG: transcriptional repressor DicA [Pelotomaculum sp. PtaB.Bin104]